MVARCCRFDEARSVTLGGPLCVQAATARHFAAQQYPAVYRFLRLLHRVDSQLSCLPAAVRIEAKISARSYHPDVTKSPGTPLPSSTRRHSLTLRWDSKPQPGHFAAGQQHEVNSPSDLVHAVGATVIEVSTSWKTNRQSTWQRREGQAQS